jgi:VanZ family protein
MIRLWWGLGAVFVALASIVCIMPMPPIVNAHNFNDKLAHLLGHAALAVYFSGLVQRAAWWKIFVFLLAFGIGIEFVQHYMDAGRDGDPRDVLGNSAGCLLGLFAGHVGLSRWPQWADALLGRPPR